MGACVNCVSHLFPWLNDRNNLLCITFMYVHVRVLLLIAECLSVRLLILQCRLFLVGRF